MKLLIILFTFLIGSNLNAQVFVPDCVPMKVTCQAFLTDTDNVMQDLGLVKFEVSCKGYIYLKRTNIASKEKKLLKSFVYVKSTKTYIDSDGVHWTLKHYQSASEMLSKTGVLILLIDQK